MGRFADCPFDPAPFQTPRSIRCHSLWAPCARYYSVILSNASLVFSLEYLVKFAVFLFFFFLSWKGDEGFNRLTYNSFQPVKDVQFCSWRNCFLVHNNTLILRFWFLGRQSCYELYSRDNVFREHCVSLLRVYLGQASTAWNKIMFRIFNT